MNVIRIALTILSSAALFIQSASAVTADELARYLGVSAWTTKVDLAPMSFVVEIHQIVDGAVGKRLIEGMPAWSKKPESGFTVLVGTQNGKYKVTIAYGAGVTMSADSETATFNHTMSQSLPDKIQEGDFVLFGKPTPDGARGPADDIRNFSSGFLLRVKKAEALAAEEPKARQCLANAKMIATACKLYAFDNGGRFPTKHTELLPDYLADPKVFNSPLAPAPDEFGYELSGGKDTDEPSKVLVLGRFTTTDGRRSVVYVNQWGALEWR